MGTTEQKLIYLGETKRLLRESINSKGANLGINTPFRDYVDAINSLKKPATSIVDSTNPFGDGSLVAKYKFDGNTLDTCGNYNGVALGSVTYEGGLFGSAMNTGVYTSTMKGMTFNNNSHINLNKFALSVFLKNDSYLALGGGSYWADSQRRLAVNVGYDSGKGKYVVGIDNGSLSGGIYNAPSHKYLTSLNPNGWVHVVVNIDLVLHTMQAFVDMEALPKVTSSYITTSGYNSHIGSSGLNIQGSRFTAEHLEIYNRHLTQLEVNILNKQEIE